MNRVLGQLKPPATILKNLYVVPFDKSASIAQIVVANQAALDATFRISVSPLAIADNLAQYLFYDTKICANETLSLSVNSMLAGTDIIRVYSSSGNLSFTVLGTDSRLPMRP